MASDRISKLPDEILTHILSLLPTNFAVTTSILSKRWEHLWKYVSNICFDDRFFNRNCADKFHSCMYKVLKVLRSKRIHSFSMKSNNRGFHGFNDYDVQEWIRDAIKLKVEELELSSFSRYHGDKLTCPRDLFIGATTLVQLKLHLLNGLANLPPTVCFPNLKILDFDGLYTWNNDQFKKLIGGCPVIEKLYVQSTMDACSISSSSLTHLTLIQRNNLNQYPRIRVATKLELNVPNLQYIHIRGDFDKFSLMGKLSSVVEVDLDISNPILGMNFWREIVHEFLRNFNNVKTFTIPSFMLSSMVKGSYISTKTQERCWEPRNVPKCLYSSLLQIQFHGYQGLNDQNQMVQFV